MGVKRKKPARFEHRSARDQMGVSQADMALYLGVKQAQVGMAELRIRSLPQRTNKKQMLLDSAYVEAIRVLEDESSLPPMDETDLGILEKEIKNLKFKKIKVERALITLKEQYKTPKLLYEVCLRILPRLVEQGEKGMSLKMVQHWLEKSKRGITLYGPLPQARLRHKIDEIDRQIAFLMGWLER